jgi:hypothetical protein
MFEIAGEATSTRGKADGSSMAKKVGPVMKDVFSLRFINSRQYSNRLE